MVVVSQLWTWNLSAFHSVNWVFSLFPSWSTFMSHVTPLSLSKECIVHCHIVSLSRSVMMPSLFLCHSMFKGKLKKFTSAVKIVSVSILLSLSYGYLIHIIPKLCSEFCVIDGIHHGPPSMRIFLSTSAHHPGNSLRNKFSTLRSVCLNDKFSLIDIGSHHWPLSDTFN